MTEKDLVEGYFTLTVMLGHIITLWWAAGTTLCLAILKLVMDYKPTNESAPYSMGIATLAGSFFVSLIGYGFFVSWYVGLINQGILGLLPINLVQKGSTIEVLRAIPLFILFPTTTFIFFFVCFIWLLQIKKRINES